MKRLIINLNRQHGLSLVEILVSMVISIFLLGGVVQVYTGNKTTYSFSEAMSRIQENGRYAMDAITRDLRMAGFWGCATFDPTDTTNIVNNIDPASPDFDAYYNFVNDPSIKGTEENLGLNGSDKLAINSPAPSQTNIVPPYNSPTSADINIVATDEIQVDDIVLLTNCKGADIFQVSNITDGVADQKIISHTTGSGSVGNINPGGCTSGGDHCLSQTYGGDSSLLKLQKVTYTVEENENGDPALFRAVFDEKFELVDGIEQMQVLYGINTDDSSTNTTPNQYLSSDAIADDEWNNVTAVRVMFLIRSSTNVSLAEPQKYHFNGADFTAGDKRLRQVFSSTIALRNKI